MHELEQLVFEKLKPQLSERQLKAAWKAANKDERGIIWWKIGEGKTRIAIAWMFMVARHPRPLIICSPQAFRQWQDEIELLGLTKQIKAKFLSVGLLSARDVLVVDLDNVNCIVADELWMYKNVKSKRNRKLSQMTHRLPSIGLSGSLMTAGNIEDLYGQSRAMNLDKKLAPTLTSFRQQFEIELNNWAGFLQRHPRKGAVEAIQRRLIDNVDVYFPKEVREIRDIYTNIDPTDEQIDIKRKLLKTWTYEHQGQTLELKNAISLLIKLQQISDGILKMSEDDVALIESSKLYRLKQLCEELLDAGERLLIWTGFRRTAEMLSEALPCKTTLLTGDGKFNVSDWRNGRVKATIATVGSGASLNDFSQIKYSIFYSSSFSNLYLQQAKGRTNRRSSLHACSYYYFLQTRGFPDAHIYRKIDENKTREEIVIETCTAILEEYERL